MKKRRFFCDQCQEILRNYTRRFCDNGCQRAFYAEKKEAKEKEKQRPKLCIVCDKEIGPRIFPTGRPRKYCSAQCAARGAGSQQHARRVRLRQEDVDMIARAEALAAACLRQRWREGDDTVPEWVKIREP